LHAQNLALAPIRRQANANGVSRAGTLLRAEGRTPDHVAAGGVRFRGGDTRPDRSGHRLERFLDYLFCFTHARAWLADKAGAHEGGVVALETAGQL
jgi:hypothetical protein